jgi:hypothetical protein
MPVKVYDGTNWVTVAGDGQQGAAGAAGTAPLTTKGDLLGFDTAANRVAVGTNGKVLTADSTAATGLAWADTTSMTLLSTTSMSGNGTITVSSINGTYNQLAIQVLDSYPSSPGTMSVRFNTDATAAAYVYNINYYPVDVGSGVTRNTTGYSATAVGISEGTIQTSDNNNTVYMTLQNYSDTTVRKLFTFNNGFQNFGSNQSLSTGSGYWNNIAAITSVSIIASAGTWTQGTIKIWGIK